MKKRNGRDHQLPAEVNTGCAAGRSFFILHSSFIILFSTWRPGKTPVSGHLKIPLATWPKRGRFWYGSNPT
jgi:hypothetical protein